jgi:hypothetical protein
MRSKLRELGYDVPSRRYGFADEAEGETRDNNATRQPPVNDHARGKSPVPALGANTNSRRLYATGLTHFQQSMRSTNLRPHRGNGSGTGAKRSSTSRTSNSFTTRSA